MRDALLSYFSSETLSWAGFVGLIAALVGEAGNALIAIITGWEKAQKELALVLAIVAAGAYAIERVGDDAIIDALKTRASRAEQELKKFEPRDLSLSAQQSVASAIQSFKGQRFTGSVTPAVEDGCSFWVTLKAALEKGGWIRRPEAPNAITTCDPPAGVPITTDPGVAIRLHAAKQAVLSPAAIALQNALVNQHIKTVIKTLGNDRDDNENNVVVIEIGARAPLP